MSLLGLIFLLACHYLMGFGLVCFFKPALNATARTALSVIAGVVLTAFVPFLIELLSIPISIYSVGAGLITVAVLLNFRHYTLLRDELRSFSLARLLSSIKIYEWPFIILFTIMIASSAWRAFYLPTNVRDILSGPEPIAEYAVREGSMINSVFTINLETTNNHQKPPFITCLQIVYKLFGFPFGQIWISVLSLAFTVFMYQVLRKELHPLLACALTMIFVTIPELYAYTYILLFDYSNMVLFFTGFYFLVSYFRSDERRELYLSAVLFAFATYIRLETVILIALALPALWMHNYQRKRTMKETIMQSALILLSSGVVYLLWVHIYMKFYMPVQFQLGSQINPRLADLTPLWQRLKDMNTRLLFAGFGTSLWGYFIFFSPVFIIADLLIKRKTSLEHRNWLYGVALVYFGLPLIGYLLPLADLMNTTKRGLFKMMPMLIMVIAHSASVKQLSAAITNWEHKAPPAKPAPASGRTDVQNKKKK